MTIGTIPALGAPTILFILETNIAAAGDSAAATRCLSKIIPVLPASHVLSILVIARACYSAGLTIQGHLDGALQEQEHELTEEVQARGERPGDVMRAETHNQRSEGGQAMGLLY